MYRWNRFCKRYTKWETFHLSLPRTSNASAPRPTREVRIVRTVSPFQPGVARPVSESPTASAAFGQVALVVAPHCLRSSGDGRKRGAERAPPFLERSVDLTHVDYRWAVGKEISRWFSFQKGEVKFWEMNTLIFFVIEIGASIRVAYNYQSQLNTYTSTMIYISLNVH